ncbi:MAG: thiolase family protein [Actinomycetia bacterium]|nr:thiolase family protein [Actinomycetes bacterium]
MPDQERVARWVGEVAVVGVGETDYPDDYRRVRKEGRRNDSYALGATALKRALADAGLGKSDVDGLIVGPTLAYERMAEILDLNPRWAGTGDAANALLQGALAIAAGLAEVVALVYGNAQNSLGTAYGGPDAMGGNLYLSYVYYAPWGLTSQGGLYALMTQRYMALTGLTSRDLGQVAVAQRQWAHLNPRAIMRTPITLDDYLASRFIAEPLHLYDYCLINDGGVALVLTTRDRAARMGRPFAVLAGVGRAESNYDATQLRPRLMDFYHPAHRLAAEQVYGAAGIGPEDVDVVQIYDSFSCHIPFALEGFGFCAPGEVGALLRSGALAPGGRLPCNTSGGHLSESYMQGWNHQVEAVRQIRGECGARQVPDVRHVQYISDVAGKVVTYIFRRG